jgi:two-component system, OmpR family, response regulator AdeR
MAGGGREALERLEADLDPDLILLDVQMPEMDGWNVLSRIRDLYGEEGPRVVMCTVKGHPKDLIHGWTLGCDGYVWKPFDMRALTDEVNSVLGRSQADRQRARRVAVGEAQMMLRSLT